MNARVASALRRWGLPAGLMALILVGTSLPVDLPTGDPFLDRPLDLWVHLGLYLALGWAFGRALWRDGPPSWAAFAGVLTAGALFAAADEIHQAWVPNRVPSAIEWAVDLVGILLGLLVVRLTRLLRGGGRSGEAGSGERTRVDLHAHLMAGVDDGPPAAEEARRALTTLGRAGVATAVATPHVNASTVANPKGREARLAALDAGWEQLTALAGEAEDAPEVRRGAEVRLDGPELVLSDRRLRLGGGRTVLVEFPGFRLPPFPGEQLREIREAGWRPLLAHPERYAGITDRLEEVRRWKEAGVRLQVNAGSLVGAYGGRFTPAAWRLLEEGVADCLASDFHGRSGPYLAEARGALDKRGGEEAWEPLAVVNPRRLLEDQPTVTVPPVPPASVWRRIVG